MNERADVALMIFHALMSRDAVRLDLYPELGDKQIRLAFALADNFLAIAKDTNDERFWGETKKEDEK